MASRGSLNICIYNGKRARLWVRALSRVVCHMHIASIRAHQGGRREERETDVKTVYAFQNDDGLLSGVSVDYVHIDVA